MNIISQLNCEKLNTCWDMYSIKKTSNIKHNFTSKKSIEIEVVLHELCTNTFKSIEGALSQVYISHMDMDTTTHSSTPLHMCVHYSHSTCIKGIQKGRREELVQFLSRKKSPSVLKLINTLGVVIFWSGCEALSLCIRFFLL